MGKFSKKMRAGIKANAMKYPDVMTELPKQLWPDEYRPRNVTRVFVSKHYIAQVYTEPGMVLRLSITRAEMMGSRAKGDISWENLQKIKSACGFGKFFAVEVYPEDGREVNIANMRHLWLFPSRDYLPNIGW